MKSALDAIAELGAEKAIIGMPHRGRLNLLAGIIRIPFETIFAQFQGIEPNEVKNGDLRYISGDVKSHIASNYTRNYPDGK